MPEPTPTETEEKEIVVTGTRLKSQTDSGGGAPIFSYATYVPSPLIDLFAENGGGETAESVRFEYDGLDLYITLPGINLRIKLPGSDRIAMTSDQFARFVKVMTEWQDSPEFAETIRAADSHGLREIVIRFDDVVHRADGGTEPYLPNQYAEASIGYAQNPDGTANYSRIIAIAINIDSSRVPGIDGTYDSRPATGGGTSLITFEWLLLHEFRHIFYPGDGGDAEEELVNRDADKMLKDIFATPGTVERAPEDYTSAVTFAGSMYNDTAAGGGAGDTLSGLSGNDALDGGAGDDLVMGGAGMDRLSGGTGTNLVMGGLEADTYLPAAGVTVEQLFDTGGVDRIDLSRFSINDATFWRYDNSLVIYLNGAVVETIEVTDQWLDANRVEQFTFAEGTYAASYIESLASPPESNVCYDELGQPMFCPYGMPVVLDLDGDGVELIAVSRSRARFDMNGDGRWERLGWVGPDDGILALDRNGNGRIDDFSEISFRDDFLGAGSDLEGLYAYDSDGDGFLTKADARFSEFLIWRDVNGNGRSEKQELFTLEELGIVSIGLERRNVDPLDRHAEANQLLATSTFQTADGRTQLVGDVALFVEMRNCSCGSNGELQPVLAEGFIA